MRRATITLSDDLESALDAWMSWQDAVPPLTTVVQDALREYLAQRGAAPGTRRFRITPAAKGSGATDVSIEHDRYLAER